MDPKPQQQPPPHIFKWIVIGALGSMSLFILLLAIIYYAFTPLIKVDETTGRIRLFGGAVDVQARDVITQLSKDGSFVFGEMDGVQTLAPEIKNIEIKFSSGEVRIDYNDGHELNWDCDGAGKNSKFLSEPKKALATLDFSAAFVDCDISLPKKNLKLVGIKGEVEIRKIQAPIEVSLASGEVFLDPIEGKNYAYDLNVTEGDMSDLFISSKAADATPVKVDVKLGSISILD